MTKPISTLVAALAFTVALGTANLATTPAVAAGWQHGGGGHSGGHGHGGFGHGGYGHGGYGYRGYGYGGYGYGLGLGFGLGYGLGYYGYGYGYPGYYGYGYPYAAYGYPDGSPYDYSAAAPPVQPQMAPPQQSFWYFCRSSNTYYPYVASCAEAWQRVPTTPPPQG